MVYKQNNGANKPCYYKLSTIFNNIEIIEALRPHFTALKFHLVIASLVSPIAPEVTRCINVLNFIIKPLPKHISSNEIQSTDFRERYLKQVSKKALRREESSEMLKKIVNELMLGRYEESQLEIFDDKILRAAYTVLLNKPEVKSKYGFLLGVCRKIKGNQLNSAAGEVVVSKKELDRKGLVKDSWSEDWDAFRVADELYKVSKLQDMYGGESYRLRILENIADKDYVLKGDPGEFASVAYINSWRSKFNLPPRPFGEKNPKWDNQSTQTTTAELPLSEPL